jgi:hypothetical protein
VVSASALNAIVGVWLIVAPWVLGYKPGNPRWNDVAFGALVALLALTRVFGAYRQSWISLANALIGAWLVVSAFTIDTSGLALVNDLVCGALVAVYALSSASASDSLRGPNGYTAIQRSARRRRRGRLSR